MQPRYFPFTLENSRGQERLPRAEKVVAYPLPYHPDGYTDLEFVQSLCPEKRRKLYVMRYEYVRVLVRIKKSFSKAT